MTDPTTSSTASPGIQATGSSGGIMFGGVEMSLNDAMAMLFMQRAETMSDLATDRAQSAQDKLKDLQQGRDMLAQMRELKNKAGSHGHTHMPEEMRNYCTSHGIDWDHTNKDWNHNKSQWDVNIQYMQNYIDKASSDNDLFMIKLKSLINKSQEATQAADSLNTKNKEVVSSIIANFAR